MRVISGAAEAARQRSGVEAAYDHFRLERQGDLASPRTLEHYDYMFGAFLRWLEKERPDVRRVEDLDVAVVRAYRAALAVSKKRDGKPLAPRTVFDSHRVLLTFFRWARGEGYTVDPRILELKRPRLSEPEATVYHIAQLRPILAACNPKLPQEELAVRILIGAGLRESELCGLAIAAPDGLPDLMLDSVQRGRVELRVRWDAGARGRKSRRVPITLKLAAAIKRYEARIRPDVPHKALLINHMGAAVPALRHRPDDGPAQGAHRVPGARSCLPPYVRDGGDEARVELRAPARGDGPRGLRGPPAVRSSKRLTGRSSFERAGSRVSARCTTPRPPLAGLRAHVCGGAPEPTGARRGARTRPDPRAAMAAARALVMALGRSSLRPVRRAG